MVDALVLWIHIVAAAVFIGPQVFLAAVAMPALRGIEDAQARYAVSRRITRGFGMLGGAALAVLVATGVWNIYSVQDRGLLEFERYFFVFNVKMTLVTVLIVLVALHAGLFGRRLQQLQERGAPEMEMAGVRRWSMAASMATLAVSITIVLLAALMGSNWSQMGDLR